MGFRHLATQICTFFFLLSPLPLDFDINNFFFFFFFCSEYMYTCQRID